MRKEAAGGIPDRPPGECDRVGRDALMAVQIDSAVNGADAHAQQTCASAAIDSTDTSAGVHAVSRHSVGRECELLMELQANAAAELDHQVRTQDLIDAESATMPKKTMPPSPESLV